jgi:hypothetical protein
MKMKTKKQHAVVARAGAAAAAPPPANGVKVRKEFNQAASDAAAIELMRQVLAGIEIRVVTYEEVVASMAYVR